MLCIEYCDQCITDMTEINNIFGNATTVSEVEDALDVLCHLLPHNEWNACKTIVDSVLQSLESLDKNIMGDYTPQEFCSVLGFCQTYCCATPYGPQEIHISLSDDPTKMNIMWITQCMVMKF